MVNSKTVRDKKPTKPLCQPPTAPEPVACPPSLPEIEPIDKTKEEKKAAKPRALAEDKLVKQEAKLFT